MVPTVARIWFAVLAAIDRPPPSLDVRSRRIASSAASSARVTSTMLFALTTAASGYSRHTVPGCVRASRNASSAAARSQAILRDPRSSAPARSPSPSSARASRSSGPDRFLTVRSRRPRASRRSRVVDLPANMAVTESQTGLVGKLPDSAVVRREVAEPLVSLDVALDEQPEAGEQARGRRTRRGVLRPSARRPPRRSRRALPA